MTFSFDDSTDPDNIILTATNPGTATQKTYSISINYWSSNLQQMVYNAPLFYMNVDCGTGAN